MLFLVIRLFTYHYWSMDLKFLFVFWGVYVLDHESAITQHITYRHSRFPRSLIPLMWAAVEPPGCGPGNVCGGRSPRVALTKYKISAMAPHRRSSWSTGPQKYPGENFIFWGGGIKSLPENKYRHFRTFNCFSCQYSIRLCNLDVCPTCPTSFIYYKVQ